jgi:hypothetical protein
MPEVAPTIMAFCIEKRYILNVDKSMKVRWTESAFSEPFPPSEILFFDLAPADFQEVTICTMLLARSLSEGHFWREYFSK